MTIPKTGMWSGSPSSHYQVPRDVFAHLQEGGSIDRELGDADACNEIAMHL